MNCELARQLVIFARPGSTELAAAEIAALESHLGDCAECRTRAHGEQDWDERISQAIQSITIPSAGPAKVLSKLHRLVWRARLVLAGKFAAVCLVAGAGWWAWPAPQLDVASIADAVYNQVGNQQGVTDWLARQDARFGFPPRFSGKYLVSCERRNFHGANAPVLTFVRQNTQARVAVVTESQFRNLASYDGLTVENSVYRLIIVRDPDAPGVVYIIETINGPVEPFFNDDEAAVT